MSNTDEDIPYSQACENNKAPILNVLSEAFAKTNHVLEIGSGTGQHAVHFAKHLPHLIWQTADQLEYHSGIQYWIEKHPCANLKAPLPLQIPLDDFPNDNYDGFFSANTAHIMQKSEIQHLMKLIEKRLPQNGVFCQYGPFKQEGKFSSQSNKEFHESLLARGFGGYRDISELQIWASKLSLTQIIEMPANNLMLIWKRA
ncbi:DUF938 domain-containing protein [Ningiella sp. W23]|uniref:DUF938 domain-containing protein n=1 Tax=Ningiella sp. W23 TaxID=3023715 RepID=UPI0037565429